MGGIEHLGSGQLVAGLCEGPPDMDPRLCEGLPGMDPRLCEGLPGMDPRLCEGPPGMDPRLCEGLPGMDPRLCEGPPGALEHLRRSPVRPEYLRCVRELHLKQNKTNCSRFCITFYKVTVVFRHFIDELRMLKENNARKT